MDAMEELRMEITIAAYGLMYITAAI